MSEYTPITVRLRNDAYEKLSRRAANMGESAENLISRLVGMFLNSTVKSSENPSAAESPDIMKELSEIKAMLKEIKSSKAGSSPSKRRSRSPTSVKRP